MIIWETSLNSSVDYCRR